MSTSEDSHSTEHRKLVSLAKLVEHKHVWRRVAAKYGVDNPMPPWKSSLDGTCDALDQSNCCTTALGSIDRRNEEDELTVTVYSDLPYPENQLVSLAHSLVAHGVLDETELQERMAIIRARLGA